MEAAMPRIPMHAPPPSFNMRDREDSQTSMRPLSALSNEAKKVLADSKLTASAMAVPSAGAIKAQVDAARAKRLSDQRQRAAETLEVTPVSISERFIVQGRPATPWAIAFVAMGIFAGATTVAFTGGRSAAIAAFIDPAHEAPAAIVAPQNAAAAAAPLANDPAANLLPGATQNNAPAAVTGAPVDIAPMTPTVFAVGRASQTQPQAAAQPVAPPQPVAAPVQVAAPTPHAKPKPQADPTPAPTPVAVAKPDPKPTPAPVVAAAAPAADPTPATPKGKKGKKSAAASGGGGDVDSAAAADALAKAQLENSL
jgi:outer membrane biosynthesis protein TonB